MRRRLYILLTCFVISVGLAFAQSRHISGSVVDEKGVPVIGASVVVKGTSVGVTTDVSGKFEVHVPQGKNVLTISYLGMLTQEVQAREGIKVVLNPDEKSLDEVVVVGYGTGQKLGSVVGSVKTIGGASLQMKTNPNIIDALQGQIAGVQSYTSSGEPGTLSSVYIRGIASLQAGNDPLYVLNGMPTGSDIMAVLNPNDIEKIDVLADASATSIYGSRAANGVIYITTKGGAYGVRPTVTASTYYGVSSLARRIETPMNSQQLYDFQTKYGLINQAQANIAKTNIATGVDTKWQDYFFSNNAPTYSANLSVAGGGNKTSYHISGAYMNQKGVSIGSKYERYNFSTMLRSKVNNWFELGMFSLLYYNTSQASTYTYEGSNYTSGGIFGTILLQPYYNPYGPDGKPLDFISEMNRWGSYYLISKQPNVNNNAQINTSVYGTLTPAKGLTLKTQIGIQANDYRNTAKRLPSNQAGWAPYTQESYSRSALMTITNTAEYKFNVNKIHDFTILAGQEAIKDQYELFASKTTGQTDDRLTLLGGGTAASFLGGSSSDKQEYVLSSFFGKFDYALKNKYFATLTVRNDGSSKFGANNKYATFMSGGLGWDVKKEDFLKDISYLSALSIKGNIGSMGNSDIGNYSHLGLISTSNYGGQSGWVISTPGNENLQWEKQVETSLTAIAGFLNKYKLEVAFYNRKTENMMMSVPLPYTSGFSTITQNVGSMTNRGIELTLKTDIVNTKDWYFGVDANYTYNKITIDKLFYGYKEWPMLNYLTSYVVGKSLQYYMPIYAGVNPQDGAPQWYVPGTKGEKTENFDNATLSQNTGKDRYPKHVGGFNLIGRWKNLFVNGSFAWVAGKYMVNNDRYFSENPAYFGNYNQSTAIIGNIWEKAGDVKYYPSMNYAMQFDTHLLECANFLRLKNLTVGYTVPQSILRHFNNVVNSIMIYGTARNLFTITPYKGADPELDTNLTYGAYPNSKTYIIGAQISF